MINHWLILTTIAFNAILLCLEHQQDCFCIMTTTTATCMTVLIKKRKGWGVTMTLCCVTLASSPHPAPRLINMRTHSTASSVLTYYYKYAPPAPGLLRIMLGSSVRTARPYNRGHPMCACARPCVRALHPYHHRQCGLQVWERGKVAFQSQHHQDLTLVTKTNSTFTHSSPVSKSQPIYYLCHAYQNNLWILCCQYFFLVCE